jgi:hypothetical protein
MADGDRNAGGDLEAPNVVRFPRDWLGPREDLVPISPSPDTAEAPPERQGSDGRARGLGMAAPPHPDDQIDTDRFVFEGTSQNVHNAAPTLVSADAFWGEDAEALHQVVELLPRRRPTPAEVLESPGESPSDGFGRAPDDRASVAATDGSPVKPTGRKTVLSAPLGTRTAVVLGLTLLALAACTTVVLLSGGDPPNVTRGAERPAPVVVSGTTIGSGRGHSRAINRAERAGVRVRAVMHSKLLVDAGRVGENQPVVTQRRRVARNADQSRSSGTATYRQASAAPVETGESAVTAEGNPPVVSTSTVPATPAHSVSTTSASRSPTVRRQVPVSPGGATSTPSDASPRQASTHSGNGDMPAGALPSPQQATLAP